MWKRINFCKNTRTKNRFELNTAKSACNNLKFPFFELKPLKKELLFLKIFRKGGKPPPLDHYKIICCPPPSKSSSCASGMTTLPYSSTHVSVPFWLHRHRVFLWIGIATQEMVVYRHEMTWNDENGGGGVFQGAASPSLLVTPKFVLYIPTILYMQCIQNIELRKQLSTLDWELRKWKLLSFKFKYLELSQGVIGNISLSKELSFCHKPNFLISIYFQPKDI